MDKHGNSARNGKKTSFSTDGTTWGDMCVRVPIVKPPKLSEVLFSDDDDEFTEAPGTESPEFRFRRNAEKSEVFRINADDEIDDLDQPLFPETEIRANQDLSDSKFFEIKNSSDSEAESGQDSNPEILTTTQFDEEWTTQSYYYNEFDSVS